MDAMIDGRRLWSKGGVISRGSVGTLLTCGGCVWCSPVIHLIAIMSEWHLEPETEYRFELDPASTLAIKVDRFHR